MILTLNNLISQIQRLLFDTDGLVWSMDQLTDFIRQCLEELQTISPVKLSLEGLDEALTTVLETGMAVLLTRMAVARAVEMRLLNRTETFHPDPLHGNFNQGWLEMEKESLQQAFEVQRRSFLQRSLLPPFPILTTDPEMDGAY